jgi:hypothetical protein
VDQFLGGRSDRLQAKRQHNKIKAKRVLPTEPLFLQNFLVCGECGSSIKPAYGRRLRKNGTHQETYRCYWKVTTNHRLKLAQRNRCELPIIQAHDIEESVFTQILHDLRFDVIMKNLYNLITVLSHERFEEKLAEYNVIIINLQWDITKKELAKKRLIFTLEFEDFDQRIFAEQMRILTGEIDT